VFPLLLQLRQQLPSSYLYYFALDPLSNGNSDNKVLTIALYYTAASVFRTGDSLALFRDSIQVSEFQCSSARITASRSFGYLSR